MNNPAFDTQTQQVRVAYPEFRPRPPWWGGDLQTLRNYFVARTGGRPRIPGERLHLAMRDGSGDRLAALLTRAPQEDGRRPLLVLLHGLSGCETSMNMARAAAYHSARGYNVLRLNLRGAGPSRPTCRSEYHAGSSRDLADATAALRDLDPELMQNGVVFYGVSLGANAMLKFVAEYGAEFPIRCAVAISAPIDLAHASTSIMRRRNAVYHRWLLQRMQSDCGQGELSPRDRAALENARSVYEFDDRFIAPRHGFDGADHYYDANKALRFLDAIRLPTLVIHAHDDPWIPVEPYLNFDWSRNPMLQLLLPRRGGHVGFHERGADASWHDRCAGLFMDSV